MAHMPIRAYQAPFFHAYMYIYIYVYDISYIYETMTSLLHECSHFIMQVTYYARFITAGSMEMLIARAKKLSCSVDQRGSYLLYSRSRTARIPDFFRPERIPLLVPERVTLLV